jgi:DNA-binding XRE family transcriptional regulator
MDDSKEILIEQLASNLEILRVGAKLTQEATAKAIGITRQTYCQIENGNSKMSWSIYLSLLLLFSSIPRTAELLGKLGIRVEKIMNDLNEQIRN